MLFSFPFCIVWEIAIVDSRGILHYDRKASNYALRLWSATILSKPGSFSLQRGRSILKTYLSETSTDVINPNNVASASVGVAPPRIQKGSLPSRLDLESTKLDSRRSLRACHISRLKAAISSELYRPVPCP